MRDNREEDAVFSPHPFRRKCEMETAELLSVEALVQDLSARKILTLGRGAGVLSKNLQSLGYYVVGCEDFPCGKEALSMDDFDVVVCLGVLELLQEPCIESFLENLKLKCDRVIFVVSTTFSDEALINGSNVHRTIRPREWWIDRLCKIYNPVQEIRLPEATSCCFATWSVDEKTVSVLGGIYKKTMTRRAIRRKILKPWRKIICELTPFVKRSEIFDELSGKTVAVVGNAVSLQKQDLGEEIDSHDIVLRMNRAPILSDRSHGLRTDWIATSMEISQELAVVKKARLIMWMTPKTERFPFWMCLKYRKVYRHKNDIWKDLRCRLPKRPSTGAMVLDLLRRSNAAKISIYGFDRGASGSISGEQKTHFAPHDFDAEWGILEEWSEQDGRVKIRAGK
jgi:hypothetical protein